MQAQRARRFSLLVGLMLIAVALAPPPPPAGAQEPRFDALLFTKTAAFRHDSIPAGVTAIQELATANGFTVTHTEDSTQFNDANLANYDVVIWLSTTGDVLNETRAGCVRALHPGRGRLRRRPRGRGHGVRLAVVRRPRRRLLPVASREPGGDGGRRGPGAPGHPAPAGGVGADGRALQLPDQSAGYRARARDAARVHLRPGGGRDGRRPPDRVVPGLRRRPRVLHRTRPHDRVLRRARLPPASARRDRDRVRRDARRLRRDRVVELREGRARPEHGGPVRARRRPGRARLLRRARRRRQGLPAGRAEHGRRRARRRLHRPGERPARPRAGPGVRDEQLDLPLLRRAGHAAVPGQRSGRDGVRPPAALALHAERQHAGPGVRAGAARVPDPARRVLPLVGHARLRRAGQPVPRHGRQHQPVRLERLRADRRARRTLVVGRPALARPTPTTCAASCCGSIPSRTARTPCPPGTCSRPAPSGRGRRSTRWASATRSG